MAVTFAEYVRRAKPCVPPLPLVHTTDVHAFRAVLETQSLRPTRCPHFREDLLYFFYGRPAYVAKNNNSAVSHFYWPVCFVLTPDIVVLPRRVYPFDSGAFSLKLYQDQLHHEMTLDAFEVDKSLHAAAQIVASFFESNGRYVEGTPQTSAAHGPLDLEVSAYLNLISRTGATQYDDRRYTIEVQLDVQLDLYNNVAAVVLPSVLLDDPAVTDALSRWGADPLTYDSIAGMDYRLYSGMIRRVLNEYMKTKGWL